MTFPFFLFHKCHEANLINYLFHCHMLNSSALIIILNNSKYINRLCFLNFVLFGNYNRPSFHATHLLNSCTKLTDWILIDVLVSTFTSFDWKYLVFADCECVYYRHNSTGFNEEIPSLLSVHFLGVRAQPRTANPLLPNRFRWSSPIVTNCNFPPPLSLHILMLKIIIIEWIYLQILLLLLIDCVAWTSLFSSKPPLSVSVQLWPSPFASRNVVLLWLH